jgi:hypothetical protein
MHQQPLWTPRSEKRLTKSGQFSGVTGEKVREDVEDIVFSNQ